MVLLYQNPSGAVKTVFTMAKIKDTHSSTGGVSKSNYLEIHLVHNDYYSENEKVTGTWEGKLAAILEIEGMEIKAGDKNFELIRKNINPLTGKKLTPRNREGGIRFYDFQCSAQKSVSIMAITLDDDRLRKAHKDSLSLALKELERFAACRDNSKPGTLLPPKTTGNICASVFHHDASRSLDPQLHSHCVVANATYDERTKRIVSLQESDMVKAIRYAGKVYQNELAKNVIKCGYDIKEKINSKGIIEGFEITGVPEEILKLYSKRRAVIEKEMEKFESKTGRKPTTEEIHIITKDSRNKKLAEITGDEVRKYQLEQLGAYSEIQLLNLKNNAIKSEREIKCNADYEKISEYSIGHLYQRKSVLKGNDVLAESLNQDLGNIDLEELKKTVIANKELVKIKSTEKNKVLSEYYSTKTGLAIEKLSVEKINETKNIFNSINTEYKPFSSEKYKELEEKENHDYKEQRKAVTEVLSNKDQFMILRGVAGAGKTTLLQELSNGLKEGDQENIHTLAPTKTAVNELKKNGFKNSHTVKKFIIDSVNNKLELHNGYLIIDEAGLKSNIDGIQIIDTALKNNMRVLFVGDTKQHKSVEAGDFLRILEEHSDVSTTELNKIIRQKDKIYNKAVKNMSKGDTASGMLIMDKELKWVHEDKGDYIKNAAFNYLKKTKYGEYLNKCIAVAPTNKECDKMTEEIRTSLKLYGKLDTDNKADKEIFRSFDWTVNKKMKTSSYQSGQKINILMAHRQFKENEVVTIDKVENRKIITTDGRRLTVSHYKYFDVGETASIQICKGDRIMIRQSSRSYGLTNGEIFHVKEVDNIGNVTTIEGKVIPKEFVSYKHGYVTTSHKSQGMTADHVVVAGQFMNRDTAYVACSRGAKSCSVHVPSKDMLYNQLQMITDRTAALDIINNTLEAKLNKNRNNVINRNFTKNTSKEINSNNLTLFSYMENAVNVNSKRKGTIRKQNTYSARNTRSISW